MMTSCKVIIHDECNVQLVGLSIIHHKLLKDKYSIFAKGYRHHRLFKLHKWDGKISFYFLDGKTYFNLLPEILKLVRQWGYKITLDDKRTPFNFDIKPIDENYFKDVTNGTLTLAKHQVESVNKIIENNGGIILAATGAGKSYINVALADTYNKLNLRTLTIVPSTDLISQTCEQFNKLKVEVGEFSGQQKDLHQKNIVSTWQALQYALPFIQNFQVVIVDECHGVTGEVLRAILNQYGGNCLIKIGLTGTLPKEEIEQMAVRITLGEAIYEITAHELMRIGWLAKLDITCVELLEDFNDKFEDFKKTQPDLAKKMSYEKFFDTYFPEYKHEMDYLRKNVKRTAWIAAYIEEKTNVEKGNALILVDSVAYGKKLANSIEGAVFVYGADSRTVRKKIYDLFATNDNIKVVASAKIASTGLDIPRIFFLFYIDFGKAFVKLIQSIGRSLRKAKDKTSTQAFDIGSNLSYSKTHARNRRKYYREALYNYSEIKVKYDNLE